MRKQDSDGGETLSPVVVVEIVAWQCFNWKLNGVRIDWNILDYKLIGELMMMIITMTLEIEKNGIAAFEMSTS